MENTFMYASEEDKLWVEGLLDGIVANDPENELFEDLDAEEIGILMDMATELAFGDADDIFDIVVENDAFFFDRIHHPTVQRLLLIALNAGIAQNDGECANYLGALYYMGHGVDLDFEKAMEYYEMGMDWGSSQAAVNFGYCFYYGRNGEEPDYEKAYQYFSRGIMMDGNPEGYMKIADMYLRGRYVKEDPVFAYRLYKKSYEMTEDTHYCARPAHHLADLYLSGIEGFLEPDAHTALVLYQKAESYYYQEIASGLGYYRKHLQAAIDGQAEARETLTAQGDFS